MDRGAWQAKVRGVQTVGHNLATEQQQERFIDSMYVPEIFMNIYSMNIRERLYWSKVKE